MKRKRNGEGDGERKKRREGHTNVSGRQEDKVHKENTAAFREVEKNLKQNFKK